MMQRGNILFLILLAVVLFAALSYAVTNSLRGGGKDSTNEKADLLASQILQNFNLIENAMQRAMLVDNIKPWGFNFFDTTYVNNTCQTKACQIYSTTGGDIPRFVVPDWARNPAASAGLTYYMIKMLNIGTDEPELVLRLPGVSKAVCEAYNRALRITDIDVSNITEYWGWSPDPTSSSYTGTLVTLPSGFATVGDQYPALKGKPHLCFQHSTASEGYTLLYTLIVR